MKTIIIQSEEGIEELVFEIENELGELIIKLVLYNHDYAEKILENSI